MSYAAVGQGKLNIEDAVTQRDDDRNNSVKDRQDKGGRLPPCMEYLHAVGRDGLQYGNAAGQRGESCHNEESQSGNSSQMGHGGKDFGQGDEHESGARRHTLYAFEYENRGNDHHAGQQGYAGIEELDLVDGGIYINILFNVRAIGDHNAHGDAQREEDLAHGVQKNLQQPPQGQSLKAGSQINGQALQAGPCNAVSVGVLKGHGKDRDGDDHDQHNRHQNSGILLNTFLDAVKNDPGSEQHKEYRVQGRLPGRCDKVCKETVLGRCLSLSRQIDSDITGDPSADDSVVSHDQDRDQKGQNAQKLPFRAHLLICVNRVFAGLSADGDI